jgi:hypothetical protein
MHPTAKVLRDFKGKDILKPRVYTDFRGNQMQLYRVSHAFKDNKINGRMVSVNPSGVK